MKIYLVGTKDAEMNQIYHACLSEETAIKQWDILRTGLIHNCLSHIEHAKTKSYDGELKLYERQLKNLTNSNPRTLDNYPHEEPYIKAMETED